MKSNHTSMKSKIKLVKTDHLVAKFVFLYVIPTRVPKIGGHWCLPLKLRNTIDRNSIAN